MMTRMFSRKSSARARKTLPRTFDGFASLEPRVMFATHTWTGAVDANWSTAGNWAENSAPAALEANVALVFASGAANLSNNNDVVGLTVQTMQFDVAGYTLGGNLITLTSGVTTTQSGGINIVNLAMIASSDLTLAIGDNAVSNTVYFNGIISGAGGLTKNGSGNVYLTAPNTYNGTTTINKGYVLAANDAALGAAAGDAGTGTVVNAGGSLSLFGNGRHIGNEQLTLNGNGQSSNGALNTANVTIYDGEIIVASASRVNIVAPGSITHNGNLSGSANLTKIGTSSLILTGTGLYTGTLTTQAGLIVNGGMPTMNVQVSSLSLGTLAGTGSVNHIGSIGGVISPGFGGPGTLTVAGGITLDSDSFLQAEINGTTAGSQYDQLAVTGTVDLAGAGISLSLGFDPQLGDVFTLVSNDGVDAVVGTFGGVAEASYVSIAGKTFRVSYVGGDGNDVTLTRANSVVAATTTTLESSANPSVVGQSVTLTATISENVAGSPTGTVVFKNGTTTLGGATVVNSVATLTLTSIPGGTNTLTAIYSGDSNFATSTSGGVSQVVISAGLTLTVAPTQNLIGVSKALTLNITGAAQAPSTLSVNGLALDVLDGATVLKQVTLDSSGNASTTVTLATPGVHSLSVRYAGSLSDFSTSQSAAADVTVQNIKLFATGAGEGSPSPTVNVYNTDGSLRLSFDAYASTFTGGVRVAVGDVNNDGVPDIATVPASGGASHVRVFSGVDATLLTQYYAYDPVYAGGFFVAVGDVNNDGTGDVVISPGAGIGPVVQVFSGTSNNLLMSFLAYAPNLATGISVAVGDVNNDGRDDIITAPGYGGAPHIRVFSGGDGAILQQYYAYASDFPGGVYVAAGDVDGDGNADIITGTQGLGAPHVRVFSGASAATIITQFYAYDPSFPGGVRVAAIDYDGDNQADLVTSPGPGGAPHIRVFKGTNLTILNQFYAYTLPYTYGAYVG